jgi:signal transduction histidine kinase
MFRTRLILTGLLLIGLLVWIGILALWASHQFRYLYVRTELAHGVHAEYLRLSAQLHPLLHLEGRAGSGEPGGGSDPPPASPRAELEATLDRIRGLITREQAHTGDREEEDEELRLLARIERNLQAILSRSESARALEPATTLSASEGRAGETLRGEVGRGIERLLEDAVAEENRESNQANRAAADVLSKVNYAVGSSLAISVVVGLGAVVLLRRRLNQPLETLMQGTQALAEGNLGYRMPVTGFKEFALIANRFNLMAEEFGQQRHQLEQSRQSLQQGVAERTEELRLANEALSHADRTRRHFFADISHELRTPLTVIRGESQFALRGGDKSAEAYKDTLRRILDQSEQMTRLVDDLLFIARSDTGNTRLDKKAVDLDKLVGEVCLDAQTLGQAKSITIAFHPQVSRAVVHGDDGRLRQLFLILLDNAIHYSKPGSQVGVHMVSSAREVSVKVLDSGIGVQPEDLGQIFERYYRGESAATLHAEGLGLGLPVAKAIVEAHDGEIWAESQPGRGTTITVRLPITANLRAVA